MLFVFLVSVLVIITILIVSGRHSVITDIVNNNNSLFQINKIAIINNSIYINCTIHTNDTKIEITNANLPQIRIDNILLLQPPQHTYQALDANVDSIVINTKNSQEYTINEDNYNDKITTEYIGHKIYQIINLGNRIANFLRLKVNSIVFNANCHGREHIYKINDIFVVGSNTTDITEITKSNRRSKYVSYNLKILSPTNNKEQPLVVDCRFDRINNSTDECIARVVNFPLTFLEFANKELRTSGEVSANFKLITLKKTIKKIIFNIQQQSRSYISINDIRITLEPFHMSGEVIFENKNANLILNETDIQFDKIIKIKIDSKKDDRKINLSHGSITLQDIFEQFADSLGEYVKKLSGEVLINGDIVWGDKISYKTNVQGKDLTIENDFIKIEQINTNISMSEKIIIDLTHLLLDSKVFKDSIFKNIKKHHLELKDAVVSIDTKKSSVMIDFKGKSYLYMNKKFYYTLLGLNSVDVDVNSVIKVAIDGIVEFDFDYKYKDNLRIDVHLSDAESDNKVSVQKSKKDRYIKIKLAKLNPLELYIKQSNNIIITLGDKSLARKAEVESGADFTFNIKNVNSFGKNIDVNIAHTNDLGQIIRFNAKEVDSDAVKELAIDIVELVNIITHNTNQAKTDKRLNLVVIGKAQRVYNENSNNYGIVDCDLEIKNNKLIRANIDTELLDINSTSLSTAITKTTSVNNQKIIDIKFTNIGNILSNFFSANYAIGGDGNGSFIIDDDTIEGALNINNFGIDYNKEKDRVVYFNESRNIIKTDLQYAYIKSKMSNREFDINLNTNINIGNSVDIDGTISIKTIILDQLTAKLLPFASNSSHATFNYHFDLQDKNNDSSEIELNYFKVLTLPLTGASFVINNILGRSDRFRIQENSKS